MIENELQGLDGTVLDKELFEKLYNNNNTYSELPAMIELAAFDVTRSEFDAVKEHAVCYHISGIVDVIYGCAKGLKLLQDEALLLDIDLQDHMDSKDYKRYKLIKDLLQSLNVD